jgi:pyridoxal phosphate enzyme (YggS family)
MLIGPQNLAVHVNHVRSRIRRAASSAGRDPDSVTLIAVSKSKPAESAREVATAGVTDFGENYLQEAILKLDELANLPLTWHFIGGLQSNKTRAVAERFDWVHSIDRLSVARRLSEQRPFHAAPLNLCIQVAVVPEPTKGGVDPRSLPELAARTADLPRVKLRGLMCVLCSAAGTQGTTERRRAPTGHAVDGHERRFRVRRRRRGDSRADRDGALRQPMTNSTPTDRRWG